MILRLIIISFFIYFRSYSQDSLNTIPSINTSNKIVLNDGGFIYHGGSIPLSQALTIIDEYAKKTGNKDLISIQNQTVRNIKLQKKYIRIAIPIFATGLILMTTSMAVILTAPGYGEAALYPFLFGYALIPAGGALAITAGVQGKLKRKHIKKTIDLYNSFVN